MRSAFGTARFALLLLLPVLSIAALSGCDSGTRESGSPAVAENSTNPQSESSSEESPGSTTANSNESQEKNPEAKEGEKKVSEKAILAGGCFGECKI